MLTRWEPFGSLRRKGNLFGELTNMQQEMNQLFDEFFGERRTGLAEGNWMPAVDVSENEAAILVRAELPGMTQEDIELNLQDNLLTLTGAKKQEKKEEKERAHYSECCYGSFRRSFTLSTEVDRDNVQATFKEGILEVTLPKSEKAKSKKIAVMAAS